MDFTVKTYQRLLEALISKNYNFQTFENFIKNPLEKAIILRHDVDLMPKNSLRFAQIQAALKIKGTYYFRAVPESWDVDIIKAISEMGHEIGYHYECLTTCKGNLEAGIKDFEKNLSALRKLAPVTTICMHGSPMSPYDSKDLWKQHEYKNFNLIAEPYFDVDFNKVFYLTDTGRRWDGHKVSVRDKVSDEPAHDFKCTFDIINRVNELPPQIMFTFHPQRWNDNKALWVRELLLQNVKNLVKRYFYVQKSR